MPAEKALPRRPWFILAMVVSVLLAVGIVGAITLQPDVKRTRVEAVVTTSTVTTPSTVTSPPDPSTTATTVASTTIPSTTVPPPTVAPPTVAPAPTTTRPRPVTTSSRPPRPPTTPVPSPPTTPPTAPPTSPAPPPTCTAAMGNATPNSKPGSTDTISITSNVPNSSAAITLHAKTGDQRYVVGTDGTGHALLTFQTGGFVAAYMVPVSVGVGGRASCATGFTPQ